jgi:hypothetical protein
MNTQDFILPKMTMVNRWKRGWIILWRTVVFQFWIALYTLPTLLLGKLLPWDHAGTTRFSWVFIAITLLVALINLPIAYCLASETTGFFEKPSEAKGRDLYVAGRKKQLD